jgi:autotransporter-associated beta strand protein
MNTKKTSFARWNVLAAFAAMIFCSSSLQALYWDNNGTDPGTGGSGSWSATDTNWNSEADGTGTTVAFDPGQIAVFDGTAGTVTIDGAGVTANAGLQFKVSDYLIQGGALTITTTTNIEVVTAGHTNTINSVISGTEGIAKTGAGALVLGGPNNFSGNVNLAAGRLIAAGGTAIPDASSVALTSSTLELTSSETVAGVTGAGTVALNSNTLTISNTAASTFAATATGTGAGLVKREAKD